MFLKLAYKVDRDEISIKFENWPDLIINLSYLPLIAKKSLCQRNSFSFDLMFLKLGDKVDRDKISDKFKNWPDLIICLRVTSP